ncbi:MAG TPA: sensor histidine kinase [Anaerolineales bacterium]|nr:sensor histidine kinase [Anaerolineae bacterium]HIP88376.1 sensor histidine kinase [Anaerolineales bacterium]
MGEWLARWGPLLWFIHGTAFFYLSTVLWVLAPRAVRLEIARRLPLLAVFGVAEALLAWDGSLAPALRLGVLLPPLVRLLLVGVGYGALLAFGALSPLPVERQPTWRRYLATLVPLVWTLGVIGFLAEGLSVERVAAGAEIVARYGMAMPGGILAGLGFREQALRTSEPRLPASVKLPLQIAGGCLGILGLLFGLQAMVDSIGSLFAPFFALCGLGITWGMVRTVNLVQLEIERWIEGVEQTQALMADRERISRELHDGIIQSIYAAGLMLEGVMQMISEDPAAAQTQLSHAMVSLNQTIQDIRRYIFNLRGGVPEADLREGLEAMLQDFRVNTLLETKLVIEGEEPRPLGAEERGHIFQIVREALSNVARHAQARSVEVRLLFGEDALRLCIADDGIGLSTTVVRSGQGLRNIRERARLLGGTLDIDSAPGKGVTVTLTVPY